MSGPPRHADDLFRPLRPARGWRFIAAIILGPLAWLIVFMVTAVLVERFDAIEIGLLIALCSFLVGLVVLLVLHAARNRERRRYEPG
jgi:hypothetical protein